jgi:hypothetical protein
MKKIFAIISVIIFAASFSGFRGSAFADRNSPPDESIPENPPGAQDESESARAERKKKEAEERAARAAKESEARRARERAAAEKKKEEARRAEEAKLAAEAATRAASEDQANRLMQAGVEYMLEGRYQMALNTLRGYTKGNPRSADAWYWIARAHHALGDYDKAQLAANIALEIDPYYEPLAKTPSGLEPMPPLSKRQKKEPRPSMSVLPVKPPLSAALPLEPLTRSYPYLAGGAGDGAASGDAGGTGNEAYLRYEPYPPMQPGRTAGWMSLDANFNEIGRWRFRVDRMGILKSPRVPVAWKGTRPYEAYFWTGKEWARVRRARLRQPFDIILYRARNDIAAVASNDGLAWDERDTPSLAASASLMRYIWMGDIDFANAARRVAKAQSADVKSGE